MAVGLSAVSDVGHMASSATANSSTNDEGATVTTRQCATTNRVPPTFAALCFRLAAGWRLIDAGCCQSPRSRCSRISSSQMQLLSLSNCDSCSDSDVNDVFCVTSSTGESKTYRRWQFEVAYWTIEVFLISTSNTTCTIDGETINISI